jgi:RNA polymerase sigma-70 factor (ECF subfamily)
MNDINKFKEDLVALEDSMFIFARSLTTNTNDAMDLVQETYLKALRCHDKFEYKDDGLKPWLFMIMRNVFINNYRKKIAWATKLDDSYSKLLISKPDHVTPESQYLHGELCRQIDKLDPDLCIPFRMYIQGYKYDEIADKLDIKAGTVKSRIFNTRQKLMKILRSQ